MYNFGIFLANEANEENRKKERKEENKYIYEVDFSTAIRTARKYFLRDTDKHPVDIIRLLSKFVHAVKERFRSYEKAVEGNRGNSLLIPLNQPKRIVSVWRAAASCSVCHT